LVAAVAAALAVLASVAPAGSLAATESLVRDINPGTGDSAPYNLANLAGTLYFNATDPAHGAELWRSDGTAAGTRLVRDIDPGAGSSHPFYLTAVGGTLFFQAYDPAHGFELWRSDGTAAGTRLVRDIALGTTSSYPDSLTRVGNVLYFVTSDAAHGTGLWKSDGTSAGTSLLKSIQATRTDSFIGELTSAGGALYFVARGRLWRSDGTVAGTRPVRDARGETIDGPDLLVAMGGTLYLYAFGEAPKGLWRSDGTAAGTRLVHRCCAPVLAVGNTLFLEGLNSAYGLWTSDGTAAGTRFVTGVGPGITPFQHDGNPNIATVGSTVFFRASDDSHGVELWKTDGTDAGTKLVKDINQSQGLFNDSNPSHLTNVAGTLFFAADDGIHGQELWSSDGTAAGTKLVRDVAPGDASSFPQSLASVGGTLFLQASNPSRGAELWKAVP
jgi:ELWxxDGT repeat protein